MMMSSWKWKKEAIMELLLRKMELKNVLSFNALVKSYAYNTFRIKGTCQGRDIVILIDSDNAHSFVSELVIKEIKVIVEKTTTLFLKRYNEM
jgi:hypothetical protein